MTPFIGVLFARARDVLTPPNAFSLDGWKEGCLPSAARISTLPRGSRAWLPNHAFSWLPTYVHYLRWSVINSSDLWVFVCVPRSSGSSISFALFCLGSGARRAVSTAYLAPGF